MGGMGAMSGPGSPFGGPGGAPVRLSPGPSMPPAGVPMKPAAGPPVVQQRKSSAIRIVNPNSKEEVKGDFKKPEPDKPKEVHLIDGKRNQNASICLGRVKLSNDDVTAALVRLDPELLSPEGTEMWIGLIPTPEEYEQVAGYPGDQTLLAKVERFFLAVGKIPRLQERLARGPAVAPVQGLGSRPLRFEARWREFDDVPSTRVGETAPAPAEDTSWRPHTFADRQRLETQLAPDGAVVTESARVCSYYASEQVL